MKKPTTYLIVIFSLVLFGSLSHAATIDISMQNTAFQPQSVTINVGDTVRWTNNDTGMFHTTTSGIGCTPNGIWDSGFLAPGQTFEMTFNTPGNFPFHCRIHCASDNMVGTIVVTGVPGASMSVPSVPQEFVFQPVESAVVNPNPALAIPIGLGSVATGGHTLSLNVSLSQFSGPVDVYFLIYVPAIDRDNIYQVKPSGGLQKLSEGLSPLNANTTGPINKDIFGDIPTFLLPDGQYFFAVLVTPSGDQSLSAFYLWVTFVSISGIF